MLLHRGSTWTIYVIAVWMYCFTWKVCSFFLYFTMGIFLRYIIFILTGLFYIYNSIKGIILIFKSRVLTTTQKVVNSVLTVSIPFIWFYLLKDFLTVETPVVTKEIRDKRRKENIGRPCGVPETLG